MAPPDGNVNDLDIIYGIHAVREALRAGTRPFLRLRLIRQDRQFEDLIRLARSLRIPVHIEPRQALDRLIPDGKHQGVVGVLAARRYASMEDILQHARTRSEPPFIIILDGVEDPHNLGAVLRTAEAAGVHGVFVPARRSAGLTASVAKASAGAVEHIRVGCAENLSRLIEALKKEGLWIYGLDQRADKSYTTLDLQGPLGLVFGGEGKGIRRGVLDKCDEQVKIPMHGRVASVNVSAAAAIAIFETARQRSLQCISPDSL